MGRKFQPNVSHEKLVKEMFEELGRVDALMHTRDLRDRVGKLLHDEWHEGHAMGWYNANQVISRIVTRLLSEGSYRTMRNSKETVYKLTSLSAEDKKTLIKLVKDLLV